MSRSLYYTRDLLIVTSCFPYNLVEKFHERAFSDGKFLAPETKSIPNKQMNIALFIERVSIMHHQNHPLQAKIKLEPVFCTTLFKLSNIQNFAISTLFEKELTQRFGILLHGGHCYETGLHILIHQQIS